MNTIAQGLLLLLRKGTSNLSIKKKNKKKLNYYSNNDLIFTILIVL